jgi:hypothetical protein
MFEENYGVCVLISHDQSFSISHCLFAVMEVVTQLDCFEIFQSVIDWHARRDGDNPLSKIVGQ